MRSLMIKICGNCRKLASTSNLLLKHQLPPLVPFSLPSSSYPLPNPNPNPNPNPATSLLRSSNLYTLINGNWGFNQGAAIRRLHSESNQPDQDLKHQEIEGPTVDRDLSPLANETREVSQKLMKTMYDLSTLLALLGLSQLAVGAWILHSSDYTPTMKMMMMSSVVAFGVPFSMGFLLRQSVKSMQFFHKMEKIGRLQILTSTMQISKHLHMFFLRLRSLVYLSLACLPLAFLSSFVFNSSSSS